MDWRNFEAEIAFRLSLETHMATIGILGTGRMAIRLADILQRGGHRVLLASRTLARARALARQLNPARVVAATYAEAAAAEYVLPAIFIRDGLFDLLGPHAEQLRGKTVIDILNPFNADYSDFILPWTTSAAEELQKLLPESKVVGCFKNTFADTFAKPDFPEGRGDVYFVADDAAARDRVMGLFTAAPFRLVDAGPLRNARVIERMTLLAAQTGWVGWHHLGERWTPDPQDRYKAMLNDAALAAH